MARGALVVGPGPGLIGRTLRRASALLVVVGLVAAAGVTAWWAADYKASALARAGARNQVESYARMLSVIVEKRVAARAAEEPKLLAEDTAWFDDLQLPAGFHAHLSGVAGRLRETDPDPLCAGAARGAPLTRIHAWDHTAIGDRPEDPASPVACGVAVIRNQVGGRPVGYVTVHFSLAAAPIASVVGRDIGVLAASSAAGATGLILLFLTMLSRYRRTLRQVRDDKRRHAATAQATGEVLVRLAPHLAYEAERDPRVTDFMRTVEFVSGRGGAGSQLPVALGPLLGECLDRRQHELQGPERELRRHITDGIWVNGSPQRLALAIDHGVRNAIEALGDAPGRIEVKLAGHFGYAEIVIRDTGTPLNRRDRRRVFDAGFSTKKGHAGLGLALVRKVAEEHGGFCELRHPWGGGTVLRICLPKCKAPRPGATPAPAPAPVSATVTGPTEPEPAEPREPVWVSPPESQADPEPPPHFDPEPLAEDADAFGAAASDPIEPAPVPDPNATLSFEDEREPEPEPEAAAVVELPDDFDPGPDPEAQPDIEPESESEPEPEPNPAETLELDADLVVDEADGAPADEAADFFSNPDS